MYGRITTLLSNRTRTFTPSGPTMGDIAARAAGIRDRFRQMDIPAGEPICLCCEDRSWLLASLIATLAGAPPLIIPHAFDPQILGEALAARPFRWILADAEIDAPAGTAVVPVSDCPPSGAPLTLGHPPDQSFAWLFTGGSTGKPRLWAKTPGNLFGEAFHLAGIFAVGPDDLILSTVGPRHIYGLLYSVLLPFVAQARVLERTQVMPREILGALAREGATILVSVPAHYRALKAIGLSRYRLRLALSSAAPLAPEDGAFFQERTGLAIHEIYGSTETGGMALRVFGTDHGCCEPFSCLEWRIRDERLCVRSPFVSADLPHDVEGFFQTADRVAAAGENRFRTLGRVDAIVKIAGKRVDLEEVRERIRRLPGVGDAYVTALPLPGARQAQIAALIASDRPAREIRTAVQSLADPYGRPRRIRVVRRLPLAANGKIDREQVERLLTAPNRAKAAAVIRDDAPPLARGEKG